jgi:hypothetical protein
MKEFILIYIEIGIDNSSGGSCFICIRVRNLVIIKKEIVRT